VIYLHPGNETASPSEPILIGQLHEPMTDHAVMSLVAMATDV